MTEQELINGLRNQEAAALAEFHRQYRERVFAVARRIVRDEWDAEEVLQDVVWTVFRKVHLFNGRSAFWSWVFRITENCAKMKVRKYKRLPTPMEHDVLMAVGGEPSTEGVSASPDEELAYQRRLREMNRFLEASDEVNRAVYVLMDVEGLPKEEVAERLDLSVSALKARLHRIRFALREHLAEAA